MSEIDKLKDALLKDNAVNAPIRFINVDVDDPRFEKYLVLEKLMEIPSIEQIIFAKIDEIKERLKG